MLGKLARLWVYAVEITGHTARLAFAAARNWSLCRQSSSGHPLLSGLKGEGVAIVKAEADRLPYILLK